MIQGSGVEGRGSRVEGQGSGVRGQLALNCSATGSQKMVGKKSRLFRVFRYSVVKHCDERLSVASLLQ